MCTVDGEKSLPLLLTLIKAINQTNKNLEAKRFVQDVLPLLKLLSMF